MGSKTLATMTVNASTSLVTLHHASPSVSVQVCALTHAGAGPYSPLATVDPLITPPAARPTDRDTTQALLVLVLAASVVVCALAFVVAFYLKKRQALTKELGHCGLYTTIQVVLISTKASIAYNELFTIFLLKIFSEMSWNIFSFR